MRNTTSTFIITIILLTLILGGCSPLPTIRHQQQSLLQRKVVLAGQFFVVKPSSPRVSRSRWKAKPKGLILALPLPLGHFAKLWDKHLACPPGKGLSCPWAEIKASNGLLLALFHHRAGDTTPGEVAQSWNRRVLSGKQLSCYPDQYPSQYKSLHLHPEGKGKQFMEYKGPAFYKGGLQYYWYKYGNVQGESKGRSLDRPLFSPSQQQELGIKQPLPPTSKGTYTKKQVEDRWKVLQQEHIQHVTQVQDRATLYKARATILRIQNKHLQQQSKEKAHSWKQERARLLAKVQRLEEKTKKVGAVTSALAWVIASILLMLLGYGCCKYRHLYTATATILGVLFLPEGLVQVAGTILVLAPPTCLILFVLLGNLLVDSWDTKAASALLGAFVRFEYEMKDMELGETLCEENLQELLGEWVQGSHQRLQEKILPYLEEGPLPWTVYRGTEHESSRITRPRSYSRSRTIAEQFGSVLEVIHQGTRCRFLEVPSDGAGIASQEEEVIVLLAGASAPAPHPGLRTRKIRKKVSSPFSA